MTLIRSIAYALAALVLPTAAFADDSNTSTLLPNSLQLNVIDGSTVPADCMYPSSIRNADRFEIACVVFPSDERAEEISAEYIGMLGQKGWHAGPYISGGFTALHASDNGCQQVLNIFPSDFPPENQNADVMVLWFALDKQPRCATPNPG